MATKRELTEAMEMVAEIREIVGGPERLELERAREEFERQLKVAASEIADYKNHLDLLHERNEQLAAGVIDKDYVALRASVKRLESVLADTQAELEAADMRIEELES